jgi:hypothetical protein
MRKMTLDEMANYVRAKSEFRGLSFMQALAEQMMVEEQRAWAAYQAEVMESVDKMVAAMERGE